MATKNITLKIDEEIYRKARILAAEQGTSLSALVRDFLIRESSREGTEAAHQRIVTTLQEIYAETDDAAAAPRTEPLIPPTREEIYADRIR